MGPSIEQTLAAALARDIAGSIPSRRWFYTQDGQPYGPVTGPELRAAVQLGFLDPSGRVRCGRDGAWVRARTLRGLFEESPARPDHPSTP